MRRTAVRLLALPVVLGALAVGCSSSEVESTGDTRVDPTSTTSLEDGLDSTGDEVVTDDATTSSTEPSGGSGGGGGGGTGTTRPAAGSPGTAAGSPRSGGGSPTTSSGSGATGGGGVALRAGAAGGTSFGTATESAIASLSKELGRPSRDVKNPGSSCPGPDRVTAWGRFSILSTGGKVVGWTLDANPPGAPALKGPSGITTGSTVTDLKRAFGSSLQLDDGGGSSFGASFNVPGGAGFFGTLTGVGASDSVTSMSSGTVCGE